jgi:DNA-binding MarR family transcriptional regulator
MLVAVTPTDEPPGLGAWRAFLQAYAVVVPRIERSLQAETGLPFAWYDVLLELNGARPERRLRMQELGDRVTISRSRVSRVVDELERGGYVERIPDPADRRASFAAITPDGRAALRKAAPVYLASVEREFLAHLSAADARTIERALDRVREA